LNDTTRGLKGRGVASQKAKDLHVFMFFMRIALSDIKIKGKAAPFFLYFVLSMRKLIIAMALFKGARVS